MPVIDLKNCIVTILDGASHSLVIKVGEGNISWTEHKNREYIKDRGKLYEVRNADDQPIDVKFSCIWEFIRAIPASGTPTPLEALANIGEAATWTTTDTDTCAPYSVTITIHNVPPCATTPELITLPLFRYESCDYDPKSFTLAFSGKCNATIATIVRS
jgi:hypothetical protein